MSDQYIGLDIGGTKILGALFDEEGKIIKRSKKQSKADRGEEVIFGQVCKVIDSLRDDSGRLVAIGAGVPGVIDRGRILFSPNLSWKDYPLEEKLVQRYSVPAYIGNDANVSLLGVWKHGIGKGCSNLVGFFVGTGIGGGIVINGSIFGGSTGGAGEIGHMIVLPDGPLCGCGARGCLESLASKTAITKIFRSQIARGRKTYFEDLLSREGYVLKSSHLKEAYVGGDSLTVEVMDRAADYLGIATASVINLLNPQLVVFGGGVIEAMGELMIERIKAKASELAIPGLFSACRIELSELGDDASLFGAISLIENGLGIILQGR
ncbi:Transcriptional regulator/sugar kinase [Mesotoga infera]|uniref:Transcriptional regulator/sugar kinase n=1 Tax=Mesotoga infera TaxID=1236046 RepID=A0A7Z7PQA4_9BACT|nr:ROK family protein [Mesotoga infera]SSC11566.1 Transcriptional regulator/sugar kinase [Mesotoga infera]